MTKVRLLIRIVSIAIVTIFLMACITAGVFLLMEHYDYETEKLFLCYDFGQDLYAAVRYYCWPAPPSDSWVECNKVKYVQRYLRNEKVKRIAFGSVRDGDESTWPDNWKDRGIVEPEKINLVLQLISTAKKDINAANIRGGRMIIITDKHKFIIPVGGGYIAPYGWDWTSKELSKQLWKWRDNREVYKYDLPSKEQTVAVILYSLKKPPTFNFYIKKSPPLALFGDKKLAEKLIFEPDVKDPNGVKWLASARLGEFGVKRRKEAGEYIFEKELEPEKIFEGQARLEKIMDAYEDAFKEAEKREKYFPMELDNPVGMVVFMTRDKDYWKEIGIDANAAFDDYIKSEQLKTYCDELGLTKELLAAGKPSKIHQDGILYIICISVVFEAIVLLVVSIILRKLKMFISWKLIAYYAVVVVGILATNFLLPSIKYTNFSPFVIVVFTLLVFLNVVLSKIIFAISFWKPCLIGTVLGFINTLMIIIATPFFCP